MDVSSRTAPGDLEADAPPARPLDVTAIHAAHARFVWTSLDRLGVRAADLEDMLQEVFVVVHQRLHTFDGSAQMTTWLFGICLRVAAAYRRRAWVRREQMVDAVPESVAECGAPDEATASRQARARLSAILDEMELERRAVFVMFELDELPCDEIARMMGVPVGTVYSRLHAARKDFARALTRLRAREARGAGP
jgi:RNA polymerase sigma-70 factor (ECF subfamily)